MSEETTEETGKKEKESDFDKEQKKAPISPVNEELFNFLDSMFTGEGEFPERVEARVVKGRNKDQYGLQVFQRVYKSGSEKPTREKIVAMSNEIIRRIKIHTDVQQKECNFIVGGMNHGRHDDYFETMLFTVKPSKKYRNGEHGDIERDEDDDEDMPFAARYNNAQLDNFQKMFALVGGMVEGLIDRSDRQAATAFAQLEKSQARNIDLLEMNMRLVQADDERQEKRERSKMWRENVGKGLDMAWSLVPPMLGSLKGPNANANWVLGTESPEAYTLRESFFKSEGAIGPHLPAICGTFDDKGMPTKEGILTLDQVQILALIAKKELNPDQLDLLLPGGPNEIKQEQVMRILQAGVPVEALGPLKALLDVRMAKRAQQQPKGD